MIKYYNNTITIKKTFYFSVIFGIIIFTKSIIYENILSFFKFFKCCKMIKIYLFFQFCNLLYKAYCGIGILYCISISFLHLNTGTKTCISVLISQPIIKFNFSFSSKNNLGLSMSSNMLFFYTFF